MRAHDLLRLPTSAVLGPAAPVWVQESPERSEWVVVRRAPAPEGRVAVGVRGVQRNQRWGTTISVSDALDRITPEQLTHRIARLRNPVPAAQMLPRLRAALRQLPLLWGPTGSAGFELATGLKTIHAGSDLDIVVRFGRPVQRVLLEHLYDVIDSATTRIDAQLDFTFGAVALGELMSGATMVLAKTVRGPMLVPAESCWRQG